MGELYAPELGPRPAGAGAAPARGGPPGNHRLGHVEGAFVSGGAFERDFNAFQATGRAAAPDAPAGARPVGDGGSFFARRGAPGRAKRRKTAPRSPQRGGAAGRRLAEGEAGGKREQKGREGGDEGAGEGGGGAQEEERLPGTAPQRSPWEGRAPDAVAQLTEEQEEFLQQYREDLAERRAQRGGKAAEAAPREDRSFFLGKEERDYAGRSWVEPPKDRKKENETCFLPKREVRTLSGHSKGVNAIRFFPGSGHLLLSAGLDGKAKIWDIHRGKAMRSYLGHSKGLRDVCFSGDGRRFLTVSYDKNIKVWDTETGQVVTTLCSGSVPYVGKFHPDPARPSVVLAGQQDKKIVQWDLDTGDLVQEYNEHLGAVNTLTFVDEGRRFVSSSDDKTLRVWEFGIPVQIKYIADPSMHSMPSVAVHPDKPYMCCQSLDNQIVTYSTKERFKIQAKKSFRGHTVSGYACQVNFSPDGRFLLSGDAEGRVFFWDWRTSRILKSLRAHEGACVGCAWHPLETSKVATCGWDGNIKYWD